MPQTSIVMTTFNRPDLLVNTLTSINQQNFQGEVIVVDDGSDDLTEKVCKRGGVTHLALNRPQSESYRNQSWPLNVGIRRATGDVIIQQNAECKHMDPETITKLVSRVTDTNVVFARVQSLFPDGTGDIIYCGPENKRPYFFCGAIKRHWFERLRGYDEDFTGYGYEDDDFADRLQREGVTWEFTDVLVHHQWHPPAGKYDMSQTGALYERKKNESTVRNLNREWGAF